MTEEQSDIVIETPSSAFSDLSDDIKEDIEKLAEEWKKQKTSGNKSDFTKYVKDKYKDNPRAYEYFSCLKHVRKDGSFKPNQKFIHPEAIAKEEFAEVLREFIKKYFKNNQKIDQDSKIFLLDSNYNLPPYFWMRMNTNVLPKILKLGKDKKRMELHAWQLAIGIMKKYEVELGDRLQKTNFADLKHVSHTIIQFLNKYILSTYKELIEKAKNQAIDRKKNEKKAQEQLETNEEKTIKKRGGSNKVHQVGFDTTGLL